jgi:hypothetical protein
MPRFLGAPGYHTFAHLGTGRQMYTASALVALHGEAPGPENFERQIWFIVAVYQIEINRTHLSFM